MEKTRSGRPSKALCRCWCVNSKRSHNRRLKDGPDKLRIRTRERKQLYNRILHLCDNGEKETNRKQRGSAERDKYLHPVLGTESGQRERKAGGDKHDGQRNERKSDRNFSGREQKAH